MQYIYNVLVYLLAIFFFGLVLSPGIKRDKTMADKLMYIINDYTHNYPLCRLQLEVETFGDST